MARAKGMLNLSGNIEPLAGAPFDARDRVPTFADLTTASNWDYPYEGMKTYVVELGKEYRYLGGDITNILNWKEISEGGGGTGGGHTIQDDGVDMTARDNLNFVGFNVTDDSTNNRTTVTFPNIDLSVLSNEAFQLTTTEKAIGTYTDGKILYGKVVDMGELPNNTTKSVSAGVSNVDTVSLCYLTITYQSSNTNLTFMAVGMPDNLNIHETVEYRNGNINFNTTIDRRGCYGKCTIFYTKTTDSPLPSDEKFAGVTASGEVILKKEWTGLNITLLDGWSGSVSVSSLSIGKLLKVEGFSTSLTAFALNGKVNNGNLQIFANDGLINAVVTDLSIYYTLAS